MDSVTTGTSAVTNPAAAVDVWLPAQAPIAMPVQSLQGGTLDTPKQRTSPGRMGLRRAFIIGGAGVLTLIAAYQVWWVMRDAQTRFMEVVLLALFIPLFAWVAMSFVSALVGFVHIVTHRRRRLGVDDSAPLPAVASRTALLLPTYNEDPDRLMAGLQAMHESLQATGQLEHFDFFVLSDTTRDEVAATERRAFAALRERLGNAHLYYRRREDNIERKAGNIAEWVRRFGAAYPHLLILDADSLMSGDTIVRLADAMERHPDVALIQTLPVVVNGQTLYGRMQQFAGRVYGTVIAHGVAWWHGAESNYWGHNAIIRTAAFAAYAGLPELRGGRPFGGTVLSHDFVEAALLRRGGWALHMVASLGGSYEEGPPSLTDMLVRDRRWCQGNLQHAGVLGTRGLHWLSRMHLLVGIGQYLTSPMWALLILVGLAIPLENAWHNQQLAGLTLFDYWKNPDTIRFVWVFAVTMAMLMAPKLVGFLASMLEPALRRGCGGILRVLVGMVIETVLSALLAPVTMYMHSRGIVGILAGRDSGWEPQRRDDGSLSLKELARRYGGMGVFGLAVGVVAFLISPAMAAWMLPVMLGLVLAIPVVALTSARAPGQWLRRLGIFATPEERVPPPLLVRASELRRRFESAG